MTEPQPDRTEKFWGCRWSEEQQRHTILHPGYWDIEKHGRKGGVLGGDGRWVALTLREVQEGEEEGPYWAWEDFDKADEWRMPQPSRLCLEICFPYGVSSQTQRHKGRVVNLTPHTEAPR